MGCRTELKSEEAWRYYLERATEQEAYGAIDGVSRLVQTFTHRHKPSGDRLRKFFYVGVEVYAERFGQEWVPF